MFGLWNKQMGINEQQTKKWAAQLENTQTQININRMLLDDMKELRERIVKLEYRLAHRNDP